MAQTTDTNRKIILAERPKGAPNENTLKLETEAVPQAGKGEMLLRTVWLSLDPYMRGRMSDAKSYATPVEIGGVMTGQVVAEVMESDVAGFSKGDFVLSPSGWQDFFVSDGTQVLNLGPEPENPSWAFVSANSVSMNPTTPEITEASNPIRKPPSATISAVRMT